MDILDTRSARAAKDGNFSEKTEDLVGPYRLRLLFIYYAIAGAFSRKVYRLAKLAFGKAYDDETILNVENIAVFAQQFKRSACRMVPRWVPSRYPRGGLAHAQRRLHTTFG